MVLPLPNYLVIAGLALLSLGLIYAALPWIILGVFRCLLWPRYSFVVEGQENLPKTGPAVLAINHVTWIDGFVMAANLPRRARALVNASYIGLPVIRHLASRVGLIPVPFSKPSALRTSIKATRDALERGEVVALFPEAQLTRNGLLGPFYRGIEVIIDGKEQIPVVPVYLDNLWGSVFSYSGGRFFRKWPKGWRRTVVVVYGRPVKPPITIFALRQAVLEAGVRAFELRRGQVGPLETLDPSKPRFEHPVLGLLTSAASDYHAADVNQVGYKEGTVGHPVPGVALKVEDDAGNDLGPNETGRVIALVAGKGKWVDTGVRGSLDRDGFLRIEAQVEGTGSTLSTVPASN
ncbi:1-acyl-sn-glycerol-3-phosphate acyltransferase [Singulisphaera sp. PoT]|uniref:1-acyl-sn-glycerol-3-phosphate acyltransferase n=1 Tax=Singulisphaera sp. PoT TaxID=3411797 RepID=UPI003BF55CAB